MTITEIAPSVAAYRPPASAVLPGLWVDDISVVEASGTAYAVFTVRMSKPSPVDVSFTVRTADTPGNVARASANVDYVPLAPLVRTIPAGGTVRSTAIAVKPDAVEEALESFDFVVSDPVNATLADAVATATIVDDDTPALSVTDTTVLEGANGVSGVAVFTVSLSKPATRTVTFNVQSADGTATAGSDYVRFAPTPTFISAGQSGRQIQVEVKGDALVEPAETFSLVVSSVVNANVVDNAGVATIGSDDAPLLRVEDVLVPEGAAGQSPAAFKATLSGPAPTDVTFQATVADNTARVDDGDYVPTGPLSLSIPKGQLAATWTVPVFGDTKVEPNENFAVTLSSVTGAVVSRGTATGYVLNDDGPTLSVADVPVVEGNTGTNQAVFVARLSQEAPTPVTFYASTLVQSAEPGVDYTALAPTKFTLAQGQVAKVVAVPVVPDTEREPNESFLLALTSATGATIFDSQATGRIVNDDGPTLSIVDRTTGEGDAKNTVTLGAVLSEPVPAPVYFTATTVAGTARAGTDFVASSTPLTIPANQTVWDIPIQVLGDTTFEPDEEFYVLLDKVGGPVTLQDDRAIVRLTDDDGRVVTIDNASTVEGGSTHTGRIMVNIQPATNAPLRFKVSTADGDYAGAQAHAGSDYVPLDAVTVDVPAGVTSFPIDIGIVGDETDEDFEFFYVELSAIEGGKFGSVTRAKFSIADDDGNAVSMSVPSTVVEGSGGGVTPFVVSFTLKQPYGHDVGWQVQVASGGPGSASYLEDLAAPRWMNFVFPAGETGTRTVTFYIVADDLHEDPVESFRVVCNNFIDNVDMVETEMGSAILDDD